MRALFKRFQFTMEMSSPISHSQSPAYNRFYRHSSPNHHHGSNYSSPSSTKSYDYLFKILLCGDAGVGKTGLIRRFCDGVYSSLYVSTVGVDFKIKTVECFGRTVKLQIWDPAGQERFGNLIRAYFRGANAVMFVYDITTRDTFDHVWNWRRRVETEIGPIYSTIPKMLVGNKLDKDVERCVNFAEAEEYAKYAHMRFIETSVVNNDNVGIAFDLLVEDLVAQKEYEIEHGILTLDSIDRNNHGFTLSRNDEKQPVAAARCVGNPLRRSDGDRIDYGYKKKRC